MEKMVAALLLHGLKDNLVCLINGIRFSRSEAKLTIKISAYFQLISGSLMFTKIVD
jgi:hypothetical protein